MYLLLDIGGSQLRMALAPKGLLQPDLTVVSRVVSHDYQKNLEQIGGQLKRWQEERGELQISATVVSLAGALSPDSKSLSNSVNLRSFEHKPLVSDLEAITGATVRLYNDTYCAALGEASRIQSQEPFWYVNWGTGIGGCLVQPEGAEGRRLRYSIAASEIGHMIIAHNGSSCRCGQQGCWDALVSGAALSERYQKEPAELTEQEWREVLELFVSGLINLQVSFPVEKIILNGGVIRHQQDKLPLIRELFSKRLRILPESPRVLMSRSGDRAGLYGAYLLASGVSNV